MKVKTEIKKWGNSLAIRLSGSMAKLPEFDKDGKEKKYTYNLFDRFDKETQTTSMARTTGYTCTGVVNLFLNGKIKHKGICPPEYIGKDKENFDYVLDHLTKRGVQYTIHEE